MKTDGEFVRQFIDAYEEGRNLEGIFAEARDQALEEAADMVALSSDVAWNEADHAADAGEDDEQEQSEHVAMKLEGLAAAIRALKRKEPVRECSICRRVHGRETVHPCE